MYLQVVLNIPLHRSFEYSYESSEYKDNQTPTMVGRRILVSFGPQKVLGVVLSESTTCSYEKPEKIKKVISVLDSTPLFSNDMLSLLKWASQFYHYPIGEVIIGAVPPALRKGEPAEIKSIEGYRYLGIPEEQTLLKRSPTCLKALDIIKQSPIAYSALRDRGISRTIITKLEQKNIIEKIDIRPNQSWVQEQIQVTNELELNNEQQIAYNSIVNTQGFGVFLINGITGSGKTEIYLHLIRHTLENHKQALILVPEINLTPQTFNRFYMRFNVPVVSIHSGLSNAERLEAFLRIKNNEAAVLIGTRSAIFSEIPNLGIIVIDEEHDSSYRQTDGFLYHCRDLAVMRAHALNIPVVLGTATPSIETLNNVKLGKYHEVKLTHRAANASMPDFSIIDMRHALVNYGISEELLQATAMEINQGHQVLFLLNRRGYAPKLVCHDCGYVFRCEHCNANLFLHAANNTLKCHHCETIYPIPRYCPSCGSAKLIPIGNGTEKICEYLGKVFPEAGIARIDRDTTTKKGSIDRILNEILEGKYHILVGTQILSKGHHFPNVTLVGIIDIDNFLVSNDFRATEYAAQLITQVAGRAGRSTQKGKVILQTYQPDNKFLERLIKCGYNAFAEDCLRQRALCGLPPFTAMLAIKTDSLIETNTLGLLNAIYLYIDQKLSAEFPQVQYSHPMKPYTDKRINRYHMFMIIIAPSRTALAKFMEPLCSQAELENKKFGNHLVFELNPVNCF